MDREVEFKEETLIAVRDSGDPLGATSRRHN